MTQHKFQKPHRTRRNHANLPWIKIILICLVILFVILRCVPSKHAVASDWLFISCNVGQGDMSLLRTSDTSAIVIDAGPEDADPQACLTWAGIEHIDAIYLTHPHADHIGGAKSLLESPMATGQKSIEVAGKYAENPASYPGLPIHQVQPSQMTYPTENLDLRILEAPQSSEIIPGSSKNSQENNSSLVIQAQYHRNSVHGDLSILLTGDIEQAEIQSLLRENPTLRADVLKVPHHGSKHSGSQLFEQLKPPINVISAGINNSYGHPHPETLHAIKELHLFAFNTAEHGNIAISSPASEHQAQVSFQKP